MQEQEESRSEGGKPALQVTPASQQPISSLPNKFAGLRKEQIVEVIADAVKRDPSLMTDARLRIAFQMKSHSGPLPAPEDFGEYGKHCDGGSERIMTMAEQAQQHQINMDQLGLTKSFAEARLGQVFGFILGLVGIVGGVICILLDHPISGSIIGGASLVALVTVFVKGRDSEA